ncbi:hypothetical protein PG996_003962 [Apiospora saccharicola]|uniref:Uncharacterized protein n=1 Tax=Apiospora saccharicola TaxID=335842 RepID=A0ABR1W2T0_9PEZI
MTEEDSQQSFRGPIPIIVCCKTEQIGAGMIQSLKPEYDVVHFILNAENASREISSILRGEAPSTPNSHLGSRRYGMGEALRPRAIVSGGAHEDGIIERIGEELQRLLLHTQASPPTAPIRTKVPFLKANQTATMPPLGPEYGKKIVQRVKACLQKLEEEGKFDGTHGGVYLY